MEIGVEEDCETSSSELNDNDADDLFYTPDSLPKFQFRSDISKGIWNIEMGMVELVQKKGKLWTTTGIVRSSNLFCSIEETLFLAELGALLVMDDEGTTLSLQDLYAKMADERCGRCWELFEAYRHLKSLGYIVGRHGVAWSMKGVKSSFESCSNCGGFQENNWEIMHNEAKETALLVDRLSNLQVEELRLDLDVYLPNSKFRKSSPGDPAFVLCLIRGRPPSKSKLEALEMQCGDVPLKLCHVDNGRVIIFSFNRVELPVLP